MVDCETCIHNEVCDRSSRMMWTTMEGKTECDDFSDRSSYVLRKTGKWELVEFQSSPFDTDQALVCSCCGFAHQYDAWFNRCPNCGAYMRTEEDEYETD